MDHIAELLARLLPGSVNGESIPATMRALSGIELAGVMSGLTKPQELALRVAFLGDYGLADDLVHYLHIEAVDIARDKKWRPEAGSRIFGTMAAMAVFQVCLDPKCPTCLGTGQVSQDDAIAACPVCEGNGKQKFDIDEALGKIWAPRYWTVKAALDCWILEGLEHVAHRMGD